MSEYYKNKPIRSVLQSLGNLSIKERRNLDQLSQKGKINLNIINKEPKKFHDFNYNENKMKNHHILYVDKCLSKNENYKRQNTNESRFNMINSYGYFQNQNGTKNSLLDKIETNNFLGNGFNDRQYNKNQNYSQNKNPVIFSNISLKEEENNNNKSNNNKNYRRYKRMYRGISPTLIPKKEPAPNNLKLLGKKITNSKIDDEIENKSKRNSKIKNPKNEIEKSLVNGLDNNLGNSRKIYQKREIKKKEEKNETNKILNVKEQKNKKIIPGITNESSLKSQNNEKIGKTKFYSHSKAIKPVNNDNNKKCYLKRTKKGNYVNNKEENKLDLHENDIKRKKVNELYALIEKFKITENEIEEIIKFINDEQKEKDRKKKWNETLKITKKDEIILKNSKKIILEQKVGERLKILGQKNLFKKNNKIIEQNKINENEQKNVQDNKIIKEKNIIKINNIDNKQNEKILFEDNHNKKMEENENLLKNDNDGIDELKFNEYLKFSEIVDKAKIENEQKLSNDKVEEKQNKIEKKIYKKILLTKEKDAFTKEISQKVKNNKKKENSNNPESRKFFCFRNIGNNCYLNSSLQLLTRINELKNKVFEIFNNKEYFTTNSTKGQLINEFTNLLNQIEKSKDNKLLLNPENLKRIMGDLDERYFHNNMEDANEFISIFIDGLFWETGNKEKEVQKLLIQNEKDKIPYENLCKKFYKRRGYSFLLDLFYGILKFEKFCKNCDYSITKFNTYNMLELPIFDLAKQYNNNPLTLEIILNDYLKEKIAEKPCSKCQSDEIYTKNTIYTLPKYLMICFGRSVKNKYVYNDIQYHETFDLKGEFDKNTFSYKLECVIEHSRGATGGHYTCLCPMDKNNKIWYRFSDSSFYKVNDFHSDESIILLYKS